jgi:hypothetical protein
MVVRRQAILHSFAHSYVQMAIRLIRKPINKKIKIREKIKKMFGHRTIGSDLGEITLLVERIGDVVVVVDVRVRVLVSVVYGCLERLLINTSVVYQFGVTYQLDGWRVLLSALEPEVLYRDGR